MATLQIPFLSISHKIPRLGRRTPLLACVDKSVTAEVRTTLRKILPSARIHVTCAATKNSQRWVGKCKIDYKDYTFYVF
jgi:hypothetical protein